MKLLNLDELRLDNIEKRCLDNWLINEHNTNFYLLTKSYLEKITKCSQIKPIIFLAESNPLNFLAGFLASIIANSTLFLINPNWQENEFQQVFELAQPDLIFGDIQVNLSNNNETKKIDNNATKIMISTGGSSGKIKFAIHSWQTLTTSVKGFYEYFNKQPINSFCLLPLYHVSGLMQCLRSFLTSGKLAIAFYSELKKGEIYNINQEEFFISLVPTQLQYLLENKPEWLVKFKTVLVGGATTGDYLLEKARQHKINLALTYGMTETASGITILKPEDFLQGNNSSGKILPHASISIKPDKDNLKMSSKIGTIKIKSESLFAGYYPQQLSNKKYFITDDVGYVDDEGYIYIIGRNSRKIITGGENVFPSEIESVILATKLVKDICIIGKPDEKWGEVITAIYVPKNDDISAEIITKKIQDKLSKYKIPKYWHQVKSIPRNFQGKINFKLLSI